VRHRRPHLLAVDHPLVAVELGRRGHVCQVAARARLGIALAPQLGDIEDLRQEPLLLFRSAVGDQRRPQQLLTEVADLIGRIRAGVFLIEGDPVRNRKAAPAVLDRPPETCQTGRGQTLGPHPAQLERLVLAAWCTETLDRGEFAYEIVGEPVTDLGPELLDLYHPCRLTYQALALLEEHR
jgi:hypothetical protein